MKHMTDEAARALEACERTRVDAINASIFMLRSGDRAAAAKFAREAQEAKARADRIRALVAEIERKEAR